MKDVLLGAGLLAAVVAVVGSVGPGWMLGLVLLGAMAVVVVILGVEALGWLRPAEPRTVQRLQRSGGGIDEVIARDALVANLGVGDDAGRKAPADTVVDDDVLERIRIHRNGHVVGPAARPPRGGVVEALGASGAAQWYQEQAGAPWDAPAVSPEPTKGPGDRPLLPRRPPTLADYKLIGEVLERTRSQNQAIRVLWGGKDGKTQAWLRTVREFYAAVGHRPVTRGDIIAWELAFSEDDVADVAERLGVGFDEVQAVFDGR